MPIQERPARKHLRWDGFDYCSQAMYFVTVCTADRQPILSRVDGAGRLELTEAGRGVLETWHGLSDRFPVELLAFVAMPDHVHAMLTIVPSPSGTSTTPSLGQIIGAFKSIAWHRVRAAGFEDGDMWQRGYYDRVVRSEDELRQIEWYIAENPARWAASRMVSNP